MASPTIESLCCLMSSTKFSRSLLLNFDPIPYNLVSIIASLFSMAGSISQLRTLREKERSEEMYRKGSNISLRTRGRIIIRCLALADCAAALGIFVRSLIWFKFNSFGALEDADELEKGLCIFLSAWIHYFYTATYIWTFLYAVDVHIGLRNLKFNPKAYQFFGWISPLIFCLVGILTLYLPDLNCFSNYVNPLVRFLPNYLSTFVPIVFVMIANPLLYLASFSSVEKLLVSSTGRFTQRERNIIEKLKIKFMLINVVFYFCWLPNIVNGILLWSGWEKIPIPLIFTIWYLMAILNPLQAVLNRLVYRSWIPDERTSGIGINFRERASSLSLFGNEERLPKQGRTVTFQETSSEDPQIVPPAGREKNSEKTPLLSSATSSPSTSV